MFQLKYKSILALSALAATVTSGCSVKFFHSAVTVNLKTAPLVAQLQVAGATSTSINFGAQIVGTPMASNVVITNVGNGPATLITMPMLSAPFSISSTTCGAALAAGQTCTATVKYAPTAFGSFASTVASFSYSDGSNTQTISVSAQGSASFASSISSGIYSSCVNRADGKVYCWGDNTSGPLGLGAPSAITSQATLPLAAQSVGAIFPENFSKVSGSNVHVCGLTTIGHIYCWGYNNSGQIGDGTDTNMRPAPTLVAVPGTAVDVATSDSSSCAVNTVGGVYCWGDSTYGALGNGNGTMGAGSYYDTPQQVHGLANAGFLSNITKIAGGRNRFCAVNTAFNVFCWGDNTEGELGDNTTTYKNYPVQVLNTAGAASLSNITSVALSYYASCALDNAFHVFCWGAQGKVGDGTNAANRLYPVQVSGTGNVGVLANIAEISGNGRMMHICARDASSAYCWGQDAGGTGVLGSGGANQLYPYIVKDVGGAGSLPNVSHIFVGATTTCATGTGSALFCWGGGSFGQIGNNTTTANNLYPIAVLDSTGSAGLTQVVSATSTYNTTCAVTVTGAGFCWGNNTYSDLGNITYVASSIPIPVVGAITGSGTFNLGSLGMTQIVAGSQSQGVFHCGLTGSGNVYCWGDNSTGSLGIGAIGGMSLAPREVLGVGGTGFLSNIISIAAGGRHVCAVDQGGSVYCWGSNSISQLGNASASSSQPSPVQVQGVGGVGYLGNIISVAAGTATTCALTTIGKGYCWGDDSSGQFGDNLAAAPSSIYPVAIQAVGGGGTLTGIANLAAGGSTTCAAMIGGALNCWGQGNNGQIGDNGNVERDVPTAVTNVGGVGNLGAVSKVIVGNNHVCALTQTDGVDCWGANAQGQAGQGGAAGGTNLIPVQVKGVGAIGFLANITQLDGHYNTICGRDTTNAIYCWGSGVNGQVGNGASGGGTYVTSPTQVLTLAP